jgi:hypothetical protein
VLNNIAGFDESKLVAALAGENDVGQGKRFEDVGESFFASFGALGDSFNLPYRG